MIYYVVLFDSEFYHIISYHIILYYITLFYMVL